MGYFVCFVLWSKIKGYLRRIFIFILTLFCLLSTPFLLVSSSFIFFWRLIVFNMSGRLRPDLGKMLSSRSSVFATDNFSKPNLTIVGTIILNGDLALQEVKEEIEAKILNAKNENGDLLFPEFRQFITTWMGFYFWQWDEKFSIDKHVILHPNKEEIDEGELFQIHKKIISSPFKPKKSLWEMNVIRNLRSSKGQLQTVIIIRSHHSIGDGYSFAKLFVYRFFGSSKEMLTLPNNFEKDKTQTVVKWGKLLLFSFYESIDATLRATDFNVWHWPTRKLSKISSKAFSGPISLTAVKEIATGYEVGLTAVILAAASGALRSYMKELEIEIPKEFSCGMPFPFSGHPNDKLRNYFSLGFLQLPMTDEDGSVRVKKIQKRLNALKKSTSLALMTFVAIPFCGSLFPFLTRTFCTNTMATLQTTCLPGPKEIVTLLGKKIETLSFDTQLLPGNTVLMFTTLTYASNLYLTANGDQTIFPTDDHLKKIVFYVMKEIEILHSSLI